MANILLVYPNQTLVGVAPSNLAILSACLKRAGHGVSLFDCSMYKSGQETQDSLREKFGQVRRAPIDEYVRPIDKNIDDAFIEAVFKYKPSLIGFTVVDGTIGFSFRLINELKKYGAGAPIVFGGIGATFNCDKILKSGLVDFVCVGEGEGAIVDLANAIDQDLPCNNICNLCMIKDGVIIRNKKRKLVDLDLLPIPDFSIYEYTRFYRPFMGGVVRMAQVDLDRGCPFDCSYCAAPALKNDSKREQCGNYYRVKNIDKVFEEIKDLKNNYGINFLWISSETFLFTNIKKFKAFADRYMAEIGLPFWCQNRLDMFSEEKTALLEKMGCRAVSVGLEHGSERIRKELLNKHISNEKIIESVKVLSRFNIIPTVNSMIGLPDETREDIFETVELNRQIYQILNGKQTLNVFTFIPFAGTKLREVCVAKGYISDDDEIPFSFQNKSMLNMPTLSREEIYGLEKTLALYITKPKEMWDMIKIAEQDERMFDKIVSGG